MTLCWYCPFSQKLTHRSEVYLEEVLLLIFLKKFSETLPDTEILSESLFLDFNKKNYYIIFLLRVVLTTYTILVYMLFTCYLHTVRKTMN